LAELAREHYVATSINEAEGFVERWNRDEVERPTRLIAVLVPCHQNVTKSSPVTQ
jgi:hypothetical protein